MIASIAIPALDSLDVTSSENYTPQNRKLVIKPECKNVLDFLDLIDNLPAQNSPSTSDFLKSYTQEEMNNARKFYPSKDLPNDLQDTDGRSLRDPVFVKGYGSEPISLRTLRGYVDHDAKSTLGVPYSYFQIRDNEQLTKDEINILALINTAFHAYDQGLTEKAREVVKDLKDLKAEITQRTLESSRQEVKGTSLTPPPIVVEIGADEKTPLLPITQQPKKR
ncbi:hypothetical protein [Parashewanella curva]|nr:hypothetical protein [Parashewanella curva]